jgi:hypothetical protein
MSKTLDDLLKIPQRNLVLSIYLGKTVLSIKQ